VYFPNFFNTIFPWKDKIAKEMNVRPKVKYVNILTTSNRRERMMVTKQELATQGIVDYQFWEGYRLPTGVVQSISKGHKMIIRWAQKNQQPEVCVMENDVRFPDPQGWQVFMRNKPQDFDLYLGGIYGPPINRDGTVHGFSGMHCYVVHNRFYSTFLALDENKHIDTALAGLGKYVVCDPMVAIQHNGWSDNNHRMDNYDPLLVQYRVLGFNYNP